MANKFKIQYSIIFPAFNEEENILPLIERIYITLKPLKKEYEIIIVDNGSTDNSPKLLSQLLLKNKSKVKRLKVVTLQRNFGYDNAIITGLAQASGNQIVILDLARNFRHRGG